MCTLSPRTTSIIDAVGSRSVSLARTQVVRAGIEDAFAFFADPWNLEAITPPWLRFHIMDAPTRLRRGSILRYRLRLFGLPVRWTTEIVDWRPPRSFTDRQLTGPYALWEHTHRLVALGRRRTEVHDHVRYRVPGGPLAPAVDGLAVRSRLEEIFDYRADRMEKLLG
jgi:ligand-binding SRPBCC domain-containing protein